MTNETVTTYIDAEVQRFIRDVAECEGATQPLRDRAQSLSACMAGIADAEAEADADIRAGRVLHFGSVDKALAHLERVTAAGAEDAPKNFYAPGAQAYALMNLLIECKEYLQQDPATVGGRPEAERLVERIAKELAHGVQTDEHLSGWRLVPNEPTGPMIRAWADTEHHAQGHSLARRTAAYKAMLAAAPDPGVRPAVNDHQEQPK